MLGSEIKKIVFKRLDEALKPLGWKAYKSGYNPAYVLDTEQYKIFFKQIYNFGRSANSYKSVAEYCGASSYNFAF